MSPVKNELPEWVTILPADDTDTLRRVAWEIEQPHTHTEYRLLAEMIRVMLDAGRSITPGASDRHRVEDYKRTLDTEREHYSGLASDRERLQAALTAAERNLDALRRVCAEILHEDMEKWPAHGNVALAIASALQLAKLRSIPDSEGVA